MNDKQRAEWVQTVDSYTEKVERGGARLCVHGRQLQLCAVCYPMLERDLAELKKHWSSEELK